MELLANICPFPILPVPVFWAENPWDIVGWAISMSLAVVFFGLTCFGCNKRRYRGWHFRRIALCLLIVGYLFACRSGLVWEQNRGEDPSQLRERLRKAGMERSLREKELQKKDPEPNSFKW
jgi:hypothetical protein